MQIQLLHTSDCHVWKESLSALEQALIETGCEPHYEVILVQNDDQAQSYHFSGSPSIVIDGQDVDPMAQNNTNYTLASCRLYFWQGKSYDFPPKDMIKKAIQQRA